MLRGQRVVLRAIERTDLQRWHELLNREVDLVSIGYGPWQPRSLALLEKEFEKALSVEERAWFMIEVDGKVIGHTGLKQWNWDRLAGVAELAIGIYDPDYLGKGYGREAVNLLVEWAFRIQNWRKIWLGTLANNERAIRAYQASGFVEEGRLRQQDYHDGEYVDVVMMGLLRSEWDARRRAAQA